MVNKIRSGVHDELNDDEVAYWLHVTDVYSQLEGIRDGFNHDNDGINKVFTSSSLENLCLLS